MQDGKLGNVVVEVLAKNWASDGLRSGAAKLPTFQELRFDGCTLVPHVSLTSFSGDLVNQDSTVHEAVAQRGSSTSAAVPLYPHSGPTRLPSVSSEDAVTRLSCALHPWESAFIYWAPRPGYVALTGPDGRFEIPGLAPGFTYTVTAWHERLGKQSTQVEVKGSSATVDFTFTGATDTGMRGP